MKTIGIVLAFAVFGMASAIETIHHDKPDSVTISTIKTSTVTNLKSSTPLNSAVSFNVTLTPSERKKRLLPYQNFYFDQPFNRPHQAGVSSQQYQDYERPSKKPEIEPINFRPIADHLYQTGQKYTPFLESNALPGPFRPMGNAHHTPSSQKIQYILVDKPHLQESEKEVGFQSQTPPDLSAIYEKLAQLKLRQQAMHQKTPYGHRIRPQHFRERPQKVHDFRPNYEVPRYKIQPSKTTFETFTATNIDIPDTNEEEKYSPTNPPRFHQISTPTKYRDSQKTFIHHQIALEVPHSSLPLTFRPSVVRKPGGKDRPRTYILVQQGKPGPKQPTYVFRKPKPTSVVDESYVAEKFVPIVPQKTYYYRPERPIYVPQEEQHYPEPSNPIYENNYDAQYQITPIPPQPYQHEFQTLDNDYKESDDSDKTEGHKPENSPADPAIQEYEDPSYYQYQTATPGPTSPSPVTVYTPIKVTPNLVSQYENVQNPAKYEEEYQVTSHVPILAEKKGPTLADVLKQLQETNTLPQTITADNIDNSIKTLVKILNALKDRQKQQKPIVVQDEYEYNNEAGVDLGGGSDALDTPDGGTPGKPGVDYPALSSIPKTTFSCKTQRYKGFFGDPDTNCQVWHYCDLNGGQASFLCPNGTIFSQVALTCDWWYNVKCASTAQLYVLNERLYKYIIPLSPKFPEDYSGPLVDKYLALKFQEMEEKLRKQKKGKGNSDSKESESSESDETEEDSEEEEESDSSKEESKVLEESTTISGETTTGDVTEAVKS